jgi:expansin (peptidoglycan-binding protein)
MGCAANDLDVSPSVFDTLAEHAEGRVNVQWHWS